MQKYVIKSHSSCDFCIFLFSFRKGKDELKRMAHVSSWVWSTLLRHISGSLTVITKNVLRPTGDLEYTGSDVLHIWIHLTDI